MPKVHIKIEEDKLERLKAKAGSYNYSLQEYISTILDWSLKEPSPIFTTSKNIKDTRKYSFSFIDLFAGIEGYALHFNSTRLVSLNHLQ